MEEFQQRHGLSATESPLDDTDRVISDIFPQLKRNDSQIDTSEKAQDLKTSLVLSPCQKDITNLLPDSKEKEEAIAQIFGGLSFSNDQSSQPKSNSVSAKKKYQCSTYDKRSNNYVCPRCNYTTGRKPEMRRHFSRMRPCPDENNLVLTSEIKQIVLDNHKYHPPKKGKTRSSTTTI
jgi:hypothetical protein